MARSFYRKNNKQKKSEEENFSLEIGTNLVENLNKINKMLEEPNDLVIRKFTIDSASHRTAIVYIDGLVDSNYIHDHIMKNLKQATELPDDKHQLFDVIHWEVITVTDIELGQSLEDVCNAILSGKTVFYLDGMDQVLIMDTKGGENRSIEEPASESLIRGPRDGFIENLRTNTVLIRRHIADPNLRFKNYEVGRRSKKDLVVAYVAGIANPDMVEEVKRRLETIDIDDAPESGYIEQWIEDSFLSPFPQVLNTERPDKAAEAMLQGKVVIMLDRTPFVLIVPATFGSSLHSPEDYYWRWSLATLIRILRYLAAFISVFLPALYIALVSYHQGLIPSDLAFSIAATRDGVPFPPFIEALIMTATMELLREAGLRLPTPIGQTIGIVGGLVIGDAAVSAGIVSPIMVIVVALNAIASFALPSYGIAISFRILQFGLMFAAAVFGLYGIILGYIMINIHIVNLTSFGVPYSSPFAPNFLNDWKDLVLRVPITMKKKRPDYMQTNDQKLMDKGDSSSEKV
ncbi:spore germination protein [Gracilibacillus alcaliphilus]|uniref:spore germination protein n=1 Tax=Gracilibacillus alcaliphilus TaxID=1401441 RepID=UPI00195E261D|nr:spore germination protein [Gracilibacillus alcaliphilus]MBM7677808.1 spore germination protein [Gracilibacillus alcaliphilus]